jgi:putative SOS response-associated peptidase YedK
MCNLYSITKGQQAIREFADATLDTSGNLPPMPGVFPDYAAPVVRNTPDGRELTLMRWGFPPPPNLGTQPVTNVRNVKSPYWRGWLKPEWRVVVPATSFSEYEDTKPKKTPVWFALDESRPLFAFAGIWRPWTGTRKKAEGEMEHRLFSFLTCAPNAVVGPIHPKAMPVILTTPDEIETWMTAPPEVALQLQRPLPDDALQIVGRGERKDDVLEIAARA